MFKLLILAILPVTSSFYNNSNQCSNYDFELVNYVDTTNITTLINEKSRPDIVEKDELKEKVEYYLRLVVDNDKLIIQYIWTSVIIFLFFYGYYICLTSVDLDIMDEMYGFDQDLIN